MVDPVFETRAELVAWQTAPATGLEAAIAAFKLALPGWWFTVGECQVSADASCAPTRESGHCALIPMDHRFDSGFHADLPQPDTMANALQTVMTDALEAIRRVTLAHSGLPADGVVLK